MKHTEAEITDKVQKLMADLNMTAYLEDRPFYIRIENNVEKSYTDRIDMETAWGIGVSVHNYENENFPDTISITIDDATGEIESYIDNSGGARPIPCYARLNEEGTYKLLPIGN